MCIINYKFITEKDKRKRTGYKLYKVYMPWDGMIKKRKGYLYGYFHVGQYRINNTYKAKKIKKERHGLETNNKVYDKGIHVFLDKPYYNKAVSIYGFRFEILVKVSFKNPLLYGVDKQSNLKSVLVNEIKLLKEVK